MPGSKLNYKAGAASVCITPDESLWLAGYAVRTRPSLGKISDLYASALALEDETGQRFVIASVEMIAVNAELSYRVANTVRRGTGCRATNFYLRQLIRTTHRSSGPTKRCFSIYRPITRLRFLPWRKD